MPRDQSPTRTELTINERAFVEEITRTDEGRPTTLTEAFLRINENARKWKPNAQNNQASAIYRRPVVQAAIRAKQAQQDIERRRSVRTSKMAIENALWTEAKEADRSSDRIAALRELAKMLPEDEGDTQAADSAATKEQLVAELESILQNTLGAAIDVTPTEVGDPHPQGAVTPEPEPVTEVSQPEPEPVAVEAEVLPPSDEEEDEPAPWDEPEPDEPAF